ncbi:MAG: PatB family C-S lyase [Trueperaceae bacterium]|nr:PatB family C-S lyase [Trueperaceae bacterium]
MTHPYDALDADGLRRRPLLKWRAYDDDVLPLWVADMDFPVATPIREALKAFADGDTFGYPEWTGIPGLREAVADRLARRQGWTVDPEAIWITPGTVAGLYTAVKAFAAQGDGVVAPTPVYPPFRLATENQGRTFQSVDLRDDGEGYRLDEGALDAAITPSSRLLMLCHPHNPTGRVFDVNELETLASRVLDHRLFVVSDELHADLNFGPTHTPFASLSPEIAKRTVTLIGPTKAFNLAGLKIGFAIAEDPDVLARFKAAAFGVAMPAPAVSQWGALAAVRDADAWFEDTLAYLKGNRDHVAARVAAMPGVRHHAPEATYLAWLDFRDTPLAEDPAGLLRDRARLALNDGASFGPAGAGFARLNFATSRGIVDDALDRIERALREA